MKNISIEKYADDLVSGPKAAFYRIVFFFCLLMPVILLGAVNCIRAYQDDTEKAVLQKKSTAFLAATIMYERLNAAVNLGVSFTTRNLMIEEAGKGNWPEAMARVQGAFEQFPAIERMTLNDVQGVIRADMPHATPSVIGESRADREWYPELKKRWVPYVSGVTRRGSEPRINVISILIPIKAKGVPVMEDSSAPDRAGKVLGFLQMQFRLKTFSQWFANIDVGQGGFIYIVDQKGRAVYHPKFDPENELVDLAGVPVVRELLNSTSGARLNYNPVEKERRVAAFAPVPHYGWGVVVTQPEVFAFLQRSAHLKELLIIYGIVLMVIFLFGVLILYGALLQKRSNAKISQLMSAVEQSPATIVITDINGVIEYANPKFTQLTGYSLKEALGQNPRVLKSGLHPPEFYKELWGLITSGKVWSGEFYNKKKDGGFFWEKASISPVKDVHGGITHFIAVKEDISERKRMERELAVKAREWEDTFNALPELISIQNKDFRIVRVNKAYADFFKSAPADLAGKMCFSIVHQTGCHIENCPHQKVMDTKKPQRIEYFEPRFGLYFEVSASPILDDQGGLVGTVHIMKDITDRKKAEEDVKRAVAIKSEFTSMVSHELRTPLGPIKEGAGIILDGLVGGINAEQKELLEIVKNNADRLHRLIDNVLDFQKLESGHMTFDMREGSVHDVIKEVVDGMSLVARQKGLGIEVSCAQDIPRLIFDKDKIIQVLTNLVNNALKFTEHGTVRIKAWTEDGGVHVAVEDTGPGIRPEDIPKLFESFRQLKSLNERKTGGTGLGLAISREIITRHRGTIWATSEFGRGAVFHFLLPLDPQAHDARSVGQGGA